MGGSERHDRHQRLFQIEESDVPAIKSDVSEYRSSVTKPRAVHASQSVGRDFDKFQSAAGSGLHGKPADERRPCISGQEEVFTQSEQPGRRKARGPPVDNPVRLAAEGIATI